MENYQGSSQNNDMVIQGTIYDALIIGDKRNLGAAKVLAS